MEGKNCRSMLSTPAFESKRPAKIVSFCTIWTLDVSLLSSAKETCVVSTALYKRPAFTLPGKSQENRFFKIKQNHYIDDYEDEVGKKYLGDLLLHPSKNSTPHSWSSQETEVSRVLSGSSWKGQEQWRVYLPPTHQSTANTCAALEHHLCNRAIQWGEA